MGVDNNMRADFFGPDGDVRWNIRRIESTCSNFKNITCDVRDRPTILKLLQDNPFDAVIHCAAQPSHDLAATRPFDDFDVNAVGTLNLLEAVRRYRPKAAFVFLSTNKVYGDGPNNVPLVELETRYDYASPEFRDGIREDFPIDHCKHSIFGASKVAADVMTQEYGRYFGMNTVCFRGGCLTGPHHSGVSLHGFLNYLIKVNLQGAVYTIFGYKGKQVRDNIHSIDVAGAVDRYIRDPRPGEVYNLGGGRQNSCSILEAFKLIRDVTGKAMLSEYVDKAREGDHICYISDMAKFKGHYPGWEITSSLHDIMTETAQAWTKRLKG